MKRREFICGSVGTLIGAAVPDRLLAKGWQDFPRRAHEIFAVERKTCSEAILLAGCEILGVDDSNLERVALGLGSGLAGHGLTCGAITGGTCLLALVNETKGQSYKERKKSTYVAIKRFVSAFEERFGSTDCRSLTGLDFSTPEGRRNKEEVRRDRCERFVLVSAQMLLREISKT